MHGLLMRRADALAQKVPLYARSRHRAMPSAADESRDLETQARMASAFVSPEEDRLLAAFAVRSRQEACSLKLASRAPTAQLPSVRSMRCTQFRSSAAPGTPLFERRLAKHRSADAAVVILKSVINANPSYRTSALSDRAHSAIT
jgi:hypothetical protein